MTEFIRLTMMTMKKAKYLKKTGGYSAQEESVRLVDPSTRTDMIVNSSEVLTAMKTTLKFLDSDKAKIEGGKLIEYGKAVKPGTRPEEMTEAEAAELQFNGPVGVVVLKHGKQTNLGLNGMDVDQVLYLVEESYDRLAKKLLG